MKEITEDERQQLSELRNEVYSAENLIDGTYSIKMYKGKYKEVDVLHKETLALLRKYEKKLSKLLA